MTISIIFLRFDQLSTTQLYDILELRQRVYIIEQHCFYQDSDGRDKDSLHALMMDEGKLAGYARILPPGLMYDTASIGRIVLEKEYRGRGFGKKLVAACIEKCFELHETGITITAQVVSIPFYEKLGFIAISDVFDEAGIDHRKMLLEPAFQAAKRLAN
jgi:ElaA protein